MSDFSTRRIEARRQNSRKFSSSNSQKSTKKFLWLFFVGLAVMIFGIFSYIRGTASVMIPAGDFTIKSGETLATLNESQNFGISAWRYKWYVRFFAPEVVIRAGFYKTSAAMTLESFLVKWLEKTSPTSNEISLTFLPGWNMWDYDAYLAKQWMLNAGDFVTEITKNFSKYQADYDFLKDVSSLEGFLYPDTYRFYKNSSAENIVRKLLNGFKNNIAPSYAELDSKTAYQTLILASIVEREERNKKNRPIVAGILSKRVAEGIAMGADATVCYGFQKPQTECTPAFVASVINDHSNIYNTRKTLGYPPTPISSVSENSWNAAKNPEKSAYYYYLHDNDGIIRYARTLAEHNANVQKYLR